MVGSPPQAELEIEITPDLVALCRRVDGAVAGARVRALALIAEAWEAEHRAPTLQAAA